MKYRALGTGLALCVVVFGVVIWGSQRADRSTGDTTAPPKLWNQSLSVGVARLPTAKAPPSGVWLWIHSTPEEQLQSVVDELEGLVVGAEASASPLVFDLTREQGKQSRRTLLGAVRPTLRAADLLMANRFGPFRARIAETAPAPRTRLAESRPLAELWDLGRRAQGTWAAFPVMAWPLHYALELSFPDRGACQKAVRYVRHSWLARGQVALVIDETLTRDFEYLRAAALPADWGKSRAVQQLKQLAARLSTIKHIPIPSELRLALNAAVRPPEKLPRYLVVPSTSLLIIPRMGSLAVQDSLRRQVSRLAQSMNGNVYGAR